MDIERFLKELGFKLQIVREAQKELNTYLAEDFDLFAYIAPDENKISKMLADLLDPDGIHGQGDTFLRLFINSIECLPEQNKALAGTSISCEEQTQFIDSRYRRIDIEIVCPDNFIIGIENKPWARDQKNQVKEYCNNLEKKSGSQYCMIYLSGSGNDPTNYSIGPEELTELRSNNQFYTMSYRTGLKEWLTACYKECRADKVRWYIKDFINYIERNFMDSDNTEQEEDIDREI